MSIHGHNLKYPFSNENTKDKEMQVRRIKTVAQIVHVDKFE